MKNQSNLAWVSSNRSNRTTRLALPLATFSAVFLLAAPSSVFAQKHWVGPNPDNDWFTAANWNPTGAPALTDDTGIGNGTQATIALPGATTQNLDIGVLSSGTLNVNGTGELTANGNVTVGSFDDGTLNITGGGTVRHPGFDGIIADASGVIGVATVDGATSNWLLKNLVVGNFGNGTLNILNGGTVTGVDAFIAQKDHSTSLAVVNGAGGASTLQLGGNLFVGGDGTGPHGTGVLRVLNGGIVNSNRLVVLSTGTLEIGANPVITVTNPLGIEYVHGTLKTIADTTFTNNGSLQNAGVILDSNGFNSTLSGVYSGTGDVTKIGAGTITLTGDNTYSDATMIDGGTLAVGNPNALGTGNVFVQGLSSDSTLRTAGNTILQFNVQKNFFLYGGSPTTTLEMKVGGTTGALTSDLMQVTGDAHLDFTGTGTSILFVRRLDNVTPAPGDRTTIINTSAGTVLGEFGSVRSDFPGLIQPLAEYFSNRVDVVFELSPFTSVSGLTPNQESVAHNLDSAANDPAAAALIAFLGTEPLGNLPHDYDLIAPEELASIYEIGFSQAVVQNMNLLHRMDDIRAGSTGYSGPVVEIPTGKDEAPISDKNVVTKNPVPAFAPCPENHWGVFALGSGDFVNVGDDDNNARGYTVTTGSMMVGVDYRFGDHVAIGIDGEYANDTADLVDNGRVNVEGGKAGAFATVYGKGWLGSKIYVDLSGGGGWNSYDTRRVGLQDDDVRGSTDGAEWNGMIAYGADWTSGNLTFGTWSSVQYTDVQFNHFTERGSLAPLDFPDQDEDSIRATSGIRASYDVRFGRCGIFRPEIRAAWQHEYGDQAYPVDSRLASGAGDLFRVSGPTVGRDAALVDAGVTLQWNNRVSTYVFYDGVHGRSNYDSNAVSGGFQLGF